MLGNFNISDNILADWVAKKATIVYFIYFLLVLSFESIHFFWTNITLKVITMILFTFYHLRHIKSTNHFCDISSSLISKENIVIS